MISLLGSLLGFGTSFLPKVLDVVKDGQEHKQKLEVMKLQMEMAEKGTTLKLRELDAEADIAEAKGIYEHDKNLDGGSFVNGLRASVRPVITYAFFLLFIAVEVSLLVAMLRDGTDLINALPVLWNDEVMAIFAAIISFWFGNRAVSKYYPKKK